METLNPSTRLIDLAFLGRARTIATAVIDTPEGVLLVDPGPTSSLPRLRAGLAAGGVRERDVRGILATHIHLDHAGATGTIVREFPDVRVFVHGRGAPHLIDPAKLLASATRLYGDEMDRLWGEFAAVPRERVVPLAGGERLAFGTYTIEVSDAPGHASHHVAYFDTVTGVLFAGDTGGIRVGDTPYVLPPTPPPDIDIEAWLESLERFRRWQPAGVFVTHFGLHGDAARHLDWLTDELETWRRVSRDLLDTAEPDECLLRFVDGVTARMIGRAGEDAAVRVREIMALDHCWAGLVRYWSKRTAAA